MFRLQSLPPQYWFTVKLEFNDPKYQQLLFPNDPQTWELFEVASNKYISTALELAIRTALENRERIDQHQPGGGWLRANHQLSIISLHIKHEDMKNGALSCILNSCGYIITGREVGSLIVGILNSMKEEQGALRLMKPFSLEFFFRDGDIRVC